MSAEVRFPVTMEKRHRDKLKIVATTLGMTMNQFVLALLLKKLEQFKQIGVDSETADRDEAEPFASPCPANAISVERTENALVELQKLSAAICTLIERLPKNVDALLAPTQNAQSAETDRRRKEIETKAVISQCLTTLPRLFEPGETFTVAELFDCLKENAGEKGMLTRSQVKKLSHKKLYVMLTMRDQGSGFFVSHADGRWSIRAPANRRQQRKSSRPSASFPAEPGIGRTLAPRGAQGPRGGSAPEGSAGGDVPRTRKVRGRG